MKREASSSNWTCHVKVQLSSNYADYWTLSCHLTFQREEISGVRLAEILSDMAKHPVMHGTSDVMPLTKSLLPSSSWTVEYTETPAP